MKKILFFLAGLLLTINIHGQVSAKLMRYLDISDSQISFVYGGDIWIVPKTGGTAIQLTHSPGEESWPRFSPDGKMIGFTASYNGNPDIYVMSVDGGIPTRITYHSLPDRMIDWHPEGEHLIYASGMQSGRQAIKNFYKVSKEGGFPEKLKVPYGELASYSPDGSSLAYITRITEDYPFKRYRGGLTSDVLIYNLTNNTAENITNNKANDGKPAWIGDKVYFLSDRDDNMRLNIWSYDTETKTTEQLTDMKEFDISYMSANKNDIVFEYGGVLYILDLLTKTTSSVNVGVYSDLALEMNRRVNVSKNILNASASPKAKRIVFEARGELFNVPVKEGFVVNLTQSSGAFDRNPSWSPDGKHIAYWSDKSGEFELYLQTADGSSDPKSVTSRGKGYGYKLYWSPDSKMLAFIDETNTISVLNIESGKTVIAAKALWNIGHGRRSGYSINWSPDSKWITFSFGLENSNEAIYLFSIPDNKLTRMTSGFYSDMSPVFSNDGDYLFFLTNRSMTALFSDMGDGTWIYPNATQIGSISLTEDVPSLLYPKNDNSASEDPDTLSSKKKNTRVEQNTTVIDFNNFEKRIVILPVKAGNITNLLPFKDKLVYLRSANSGSSERSSTLVLYDLEKREEQDIIADVSSATKIAGGDEILVKVKNQYGIIKAQQKQKIEKPIPTNKLAMNLVPKEEWRQIFLDTWRRYRDFFYDPNMHMVDWNELKIRYGKLIEDARTRWDVITIQSNLQAELSAGHTYTFGGDTENITFLANGYLGIDWELDKENYRIKRIVRAADWDTEVKSPFDWPGVKVKEGDYIHKVNNVLLESDKDPNAYFGGLSGQTVSLMISKTGKLEDAKPFVIKCLTHNEEVNLRYLEWIENNRKMVDELSGGKLGYIYMSNTADRGQLELVRMYYGQLEKKGFIIDERFNGGGQLADRFLELLQRPVVYNLHWRHGNDHTYPIKTNTGPVGMLINGWAGSGGDGLPWAFQELKAGPIVGEHTLGILVGPATGHQLIDGGGITVPGARLYDNDGHWFWEGEGVAPDIEVWDDPNILVKGRDPQIERVVEEVLKLLQTNPPKKTPAPPLEDRTAKGLKKK